MRLITRFELATKTDEELHTLLRSAFNELARSGTHFIERTNALVTIENIRREIGLRL